MNENERKIIRTTIIFYVVCILMAIFFGFCCYLFLYRNNLVLVSPQNIENEEIDFFEFLSQKEKLPQSSEEVSFIAVGDISFSRGVEREMKKQENVDYPFLKIRDYLKSADLVFGNLETPITEGREILDYEMIFRSNPGVENVLKNAGFSILSLANNHTLNFGKKGIEDTLKYLDSVIIKHVGAGKNKYEAEQTVFTEIKGIKFAFLAYCEDSFVPDYYEAKETRVGVVFMKLDKMSKAVYDAKQKADFVIVSIHSGSEYVEMLNDFQVDFAHSAIDAGADLVIGHHPHVVQTMENYKGKFIFYSLGNFVFDQLWSEDTKEGLMIKANFTKNGISKITLLPVVSENFVQPQIAHENKAEKILKRLNFSYDKSDVFFWDNEIGDFIKVSEAVVYLENPEKSVNVLRQEQADLDNDSILEIYSLENGRLTVLENSEEIWQSSDDWWIDDFVIADSNNDGILELNLSLWKSGNFGESKPFWIKENDASVKNHFFIYDFLNGYARQIWASSNLESPNFEFEFADVDNDGKNDLIALEGNYSSGFERDSRYVSVWKWNGWGFSNEWRSEAGNYYNLEIENIDGKNCIKVDNNSRYVSR